MKFINCFKQSGNKDSFLTLCISFYSSWWKWRYAWLKQEQMDKNVDDNLSNNHPLLITSNIGEVPTKQLDNTNSTPHKCNNKHHCIFIFCLMAFVGIKINRSMELLPPHLCFGPLKAIFVNQDKTIKQKLEPLKCINDNAHQGETQQLLEVSHLLKLVRGEGHEVCRLVERQYKWLRMQRTPPH